MATRLCLQNASTSYCSAFDSESQLLFIQTGDFVSCQVMVLARHCVRGSSVLPSFYFAHSIGGLHRILHTVLPSLYLSHTQNTIETNTYSHII